MRSLNKPICYGMLAAAALPLVSQQSMAQVLDEVIVTAERRETDLQSTPIAITAVSADAIEQLGVQDLGELANFIPNLTALPTFAYGNSVPKIVLRGVGAGGFPTWGIAFDSAVAIYIDGMYYSRNPGSLLSLAEVEQVEVLRGPQGTLFGRNTTGGAISYRTYKASTEGLSGYFEYGVGNYDERNFKAGINVPLSDTWALRAAVADLNREGQINRGPIDYGDVNGQVGRIALHGDISDRLSADFSLSRNDSNTTGEAQEFVAFEVPEGSIIDRQILALSLALEAYGEDPIVPNDERLLLEPGELPYYCLVDGDANPYTFGEACDNYRKNDIDVLTAKFTYELSDNITLSSLSGFLRGGADANTEILFIGTATRRLWQDFESFQQEFQINFDYDRWNAVAGVNYYTEDANESEHTIDADIRPCPGSICPAGDAAAAAAWRATEISNSLNGFLIQRKRENYWQTTDSYAAFAQATFRPTESLSLTGGLRYTVDKKDGQIEYIPHPYFEPDYEYANVTANEDWSATDYKLALQYQITDDVMVYVSQSKAYKAGIMNDASVELTIADGNPTISFTDPEDVVSREIGIRSEWLDRRLRINATYFDMIWGNRSGTRVTNDEMGTPHFEPFNQPDVSSEGIEIDATFALTDTLTLTGAYSENEARQKDNPNFVLSGNAEYNWNLGLEQSWSMNSGASLRTSVNYAKTGPVFTFDAVEGSENGSPNATKGYDFTSARISYTPADGKWLLSIYAQNLFDKEVNLGRWSVGAFYGGVGTNPQQEIRARPRTYGASLRYNF